MNLIFINWVFVLVCVLFVLSLPVLIAKVCRSDKNIVLISTLIVIVDIVCFVPLLIDNMGIGFPNFYINFLGTNVAGWLFFINLFIVLIHNRKKLFK